MNAIEISNINNVFWIIRENGIINKKFIIKFLNKIKIRWPEIKFADSRIDNVHGRIIRLINSIITIKFIKNFGEFNGTRCLNVFIGKLKIE